MSNIRTLDPFLEPAIKTLIWAAPRIQVPELLRIKEQLVARYGRSVDPVPTEQVDPRIVVKLAIRSPDPHLIDRYLGAIAQSFGVDWSPPEPSAPPVGGNGNSSNSTNSLIDLPPPPEYSSVYPVLAEGQQQQQQPSSPPPNNDFEELTRRFEALKQSKK